MLGKKPLGFALSLLPIFFIAIVPGVCAQDDPDHVPLGDVARSFRKKSVISDSVIDNDNLSKVMSDAEKARAAGDSAMFSLDPGSAIPRPPSPDVTCSLSFSANKNSELSDPAMLNELPLAEVAKLDGPATIEGDSLQVTVHNGSAWELRDVLIGLTIVRDSNSSNSVSYYGNRSYGNAGYGNARMLPAVSGRTDLAQDQSQKQPDMTVLLHVKGSAAPAATAVFRTTLNFALFPGQEWHWAIVKARGIAPQVSTEMLMKEPEQVPGSNNVASALTVTSSTGASPSNSQTNAAAGNQPLPNANLSLPNPLSLNLPAKNSGLASAPNR